MGDRATIKIPRELYDRLGILIEGTGFASVTEFVVFAMRTIASSGRLDESDRLSNDEIMAVRERLKRLGYF
jgi:hypothetical protein